MVETCGICPLPDPMEAIRGGNVRLGPIERKRGQESWYGVCSPKDKGAHHI